jgi:hypothetical protein
LDPGNCVQKKLTGVFGLRAIIKNCSVGEPAEGSLSPIHTSGVASAALGKT